MPRKSFIDSVRVNTPCSESWDEMTGTDQIRLCSHCSKHVTNISEMSRKEAMQFVRSSNGKICIRYHRTANDERPVFVEDFYKISRRTAGFAAGVMAASLSLATSSYMQNRPADGQQNTPTTQSEEIGEGAEADLKTKSLEGVLKNQQGAGVSWFHIRLIDQDSKKEFSTTSDENGRFEFEDVPTGIYTLRTDPGSGFRKKILPGISIEEGQTSYQDIELTQGSGERVYGFGGAMAFVRYSLPLNEAIANNDIDQVRRLLGSGENVNGRDSNYDDISPLFLAFERGSIEVTRLLIEFGAKVNIRDKSGQTPLMRIEEGTSPELIRLLLSHGARIDDIDDKDDSALMIAAKYGKADAIQALLDAGADFSVSNKKGQTALMNAAKANNVEGVRGLLVAGADINAENDDGDTAYDQTSEEDVETLLVTFGATLKP